MPKGVPVLARGVEQGQCLGIYRLAQILGEGVGMKIYTEINLQRKNKRDAVRALRLALEPEAERTKREARKARQAKKAMLRQWEKRRAA